jgi:hypothetical protein
MSIFIVDDKMIRKQWRWASIEDLTRHHIELVERRFCERVGTVVYIGRNDSCKILKDRHMSTVELVFGRIFPKEHAEEYVNEVMKRYLKFREG